MYNFENNYLEVKIKTGIEYKLQMRGHISVLNGASSTGKTFLCDYISTIQQGMDFDKEFENVVILNLSNRDIIFNQKQKLIIIDRAEMLLTPEMINFINNDRENNYLIIARGVTGIRVTPNYVATLERNGNTFSLKYKFNRRGWF